jgi:hypothetical protein
VGVRVDPLGDALGPSVLPDGLWALPGPVAGAVAGDPAVLPVVVPLVVGPAGVPLAAGELPVPVAELPPAEPLPAPCASAKVPESANAAANAIVASFMVVSLALLTRGNSPSTSWFR